VRAVSHVRCACVGVASGAQGVAVGLGPAGELRYPSYPEGDGRWHYPGIGEFQCCGRYMLASLRACADAVGRPDWGLSGPHDSGSYNQRAEDTGFFHPEQGSWRTEYGDFFLSWYSHSLVAHGSRRAGALACAALADCRGAHQREVPGSTGATAAPRIPGADGRYYNTHARCGYEPVVRMLAPTRRCSTSRASRWATASSPGTPSAARVAAHAGATRPVPPPVPGFPGVSLGWRPAGCAVHPGLPSVPGLAC